MRLWSGLGLFAFLQVVSAYNYKIEGFCKRVVAEDVRNIENNRGAFLPYEDTIRQSLSEVFSMEEFFIEKFKIHDHSSMNTVTYTGYITTELDRLVLIKYVAGNKENIFLSIMEIDDVPQAPSIIASVLSSNNVSCFNGGVLLPNSKCNCPPFYEGDLCQILICQHYGISQYNQCNCPPGIYGNACESKGCMPVVLDSINDNLKSLIFVFNQVPELDYTLNEVVGKFHKFYNSNITYQSYTLTHHVRNEDLTSIITVSTTNVDEFIKSLTSLVLIPVNPDDPHQNHLMAIIEAQSSGLSTRGLSPIYAFGTYGDVYGTQPDYHFNTPTVETQAILTTISWRNRVLFIYTLREPEDDYFDAWHNSIRRFIKAAIGDLVFIQPLEIDTIMDDFAPIYTYNEVSGARYTVSNFQQDEEISLDGKEHFLITVEPNGTVPTLIGDDGKEILFTSKGKNFQLSSSTALAGVKTITVKATSSWSYKKLHSDYFITALLTFTDDKAVDVGEQFFTSETVKYANGIQLGVTGQSVFSIYDLDSGNTVTSSLTSYDRPGCTFSLGFYLAGFQCTPGPLGAQVLTPSEGVNHIRIVPVLCAAIDHIPIPPFVCENNGTLNDDGKSCKCLQYYTGDHCEIASCQNGGTPLSYASTPCSCPRGYSGPLCTEVQCSSKSTDSFDYSSKSLALVIQNSFSQNSVASKIRTGIHTMLLSIPAADAFTGYIISTFNMNGYTNDTTVKTSNFTSSSLFESSLAEIEYHPSTSDQQSSFTALFTTVENVYPRSSVYLFVDAGPVDKDIHELSKVIIEKQIQLNIIITAPFNIEGKCLSPSDSGLYARLAQLTGGMIMNLCNPFEATSKDPIVQFLSTAGTVAHRVENIEVGYSPNCTMQVEFNPSVFPSELYIFINSDITDQFNVEYVPIAGSYIPLTPLEAIPFVGFYHTTIKNESFLGFVLYVEPKTNRPVGECSVRITEISSLSSTLSFVPDPSYDSYGRSPFYGTPSNPVIHLSSTLQETPRIILEVDAVDGAQLYRNEGQLRDGCNYEYYFPQFVCQDLYNEFTTTLYVYVGNTVFRRSNRAFCYLQETQCLNGGTFRNDTQRCQCSSRFTGTRCEQAVCLNNGAKTMFFGCSCPDGYSGRFCEYISCPDPNYSDRKDLQASTYRQVVFVINLHRSQLSVYVYLKSILQEFIYENFINIVTPVQYSLITFTKTDVSNIISTTDTVRFITAFKSLSHSFNDMSAGPSKVADALTNAYAIIDRPPAQIFVFTGFDSSNPSVTLKTFASQQIAGTVNIFFTPQNQSLSYPNSLTMLVPPKTTGGRLMKLGPYDAQSLLPLLSTSMIENGLIMDDGHDDCSGGFQFFFELESEATEVTFTITAPGISSSNIEIKDDQDNIIKINAGYAVLFSNYDSMILSVNNSVNNMAGHWKTKITANSYCNLQVRVSSLIDVYLGFANSISLDNVKPNPYMIYGKNETAFMAFRSNGYLTNLEIYDSDVYYPHPGSDEKMTGTALIHQRTTECSYQYITNEISFDTTSYQKSIVYGIATDNSTFQRTFPLNMIKSSNTQSTCMFGSRDTYGFCTCDSQHTGPSCSDRVCQNGGSASLGICVCGATYYGEYCEKYVEQEVTVSPTGSSTLSTTPSGSSSLGSTASPTGSSTIGSTASSIGSSTLASTASSIRSSTMSTTILPVGSSTLSSTVASTRISTLGSTVPSTLSSSLGSTASSVVSSTMSSTITPVRSSTIGSTSLQTGSSTIGSTTLSMGSSTLGSTASPTVSSTMGSTAISLGSSTLGSTASPTGSSSLGSTASSVVSSTMSSTIPRVSSSTVGSTASQTGSSSLGSTASSVVSSTMSSTIPPVSSSTVGSTASPTGSSTLGSTAPSVVSSTIGVPCDPKTQPLFLNFFLDAAGYSGQPALDGQKDVTINVASQISLGTTNTKTKFLITGVGDGKVVPQVAANTDEVGGKVDAISSQDGLSYDLTATVDAYFTSHYDEHDNSQTPFAIIMKTFELYLDDDEDLYKPAITKLQASGFKVIGVADTKTDSNLCKILGNESCFFMGTVAPYNIQDVTDSIVKLLCKK